MVGNYKLHTFFIKLLLWLVLHPNVLGLWESVVCISLRARIHSCEHDGHRKLRLGNSGVLGNIKNGIKTRDVAKYGLSNISLNFICTHRFLHLFSQYVFIWNDSWAHLNILNLISFYLVSERSRYFLYLAYIFPFWAIERLKNIKSLRL